MPPQRRRSAADAATAKSPGSPSASRPPKRRVRSHACVPRRRRRSKCDGIYPSCSTCSKVYQIECFYEQAQDCNPAKPAAKPASNPQRDEEPCDPFVSDLELKLSQSIHVSFDSGAMKTDVISPGSTSFIMELPLPQIFGPETFELEFLRQRTQHRMQHWSHTRPEPATSCESTSPNPSSPSVICEIMKRITPPEIRRWFRKPYDPGFLAHLLDLYFSWIHPSYEFFPREQFLLDFQSGKADHNGRILVNAIAAFACRYSDRLAALADPGDPSTAGDQFFAEAERLLYSIAEPSAMLAQALSVMSSQHDLLNCQPVTSARTCNTFNVRVTEEASLQLKR